MDRKFDRGTELGRVRGLGAGRTGVSHWWMQKVTAASNLALLVWFVASLLLLPGLDHRTVVIWAHQPIVAVPLLLLTLSVAYHFRLGATVMLEDYIHGEGTKVIAVTLLTFYVVAVAAAAAFAILKIAFGAAGA